jgi:AcrR family transcriptional regulator
MLRSLPEHGYSGITIGHLTEEAGVSRAAFYGQFSSKQECFLAAYDLAGDWLVERVETVLRGAGELHERVGAGVVEALRLLATNPPLARLFAIDAIQAGRASRERQRACIARISAALWDSGDGPRRPSELDEMLLAGALATVARYVDAGRVEQLPEASEEVVRYLLTPHAAVGQIDRTLEESA